MNARRPPAKGAPADGRKNGSKSRVKEPIVAAAAELFRERGFASTSMQDIADAVGLSRPALYYHFGNKDEILESLVEEITLKTARDTARLAEGGGDPAETLRRMVRAYALWILRHPQHFTVLQRDERSLPDRVRTVQEQGKRELLDAFTRLLRAGSRRGGSACLTPPSPRSAFSGCATRPRNGSSPAGASARTARRTRSPTWRWRWSCAPACARTRIRATR